MSDAEARRARIRVKAVLIAPNDDLTAHAASFLPPTREHPDGYHRLIGGSVVYTGRLHPAPAVSDAFLTETDGSIVPGPPVRTTGDPAPWLPRGTGDRGSTTLA